MTVNTTMKHSIIGIHPSLDAVSPGILHVLSELLPISFVGVTDIASSPVLDAVILVEGDSSILGPWTSRVSKVFMIHRPVGAVPSATGNRPVKIAFGDSPHLDGRIAGRVLSHSAITFNSSLRPDCTDDILAQCGNVPIWASRVHDGCQLDQVAVSMPRLSQRQLPFDYLNAENYMHLLPLLHFLRKVTVGKGWQAPSLRACLMLDDPNLHRPSYGFVRYRQAAEHARRNRYHLALATVPLDAWYAHPPTAKLFRESPDVLSLLIHGNNHTYAEWGRSKSVAEDEALIAQCLQRIARLEERAGLPVARVAAPPHGACLASLMPTMLQFGIEGACISTGSLRNWNPGRKWSATFGLEIAEVMDGGFSVFPRFRLAAGCETAIVISAFLNRPIVPVGHHGTLAQGLEILEETAKLINSLGDVRWLNAQDILRSQCLSRIENSFLWVEPCACHVGFDVPEDISQLIIKPHPVHIMEGINDFCIRVQGLSDRLCTAGNSVPVRPGKRVEVMCSRQSMRDSLLVKAPPTSSWGVTRRILCEARDRLAPMFSRSNSAC